LAARDAARLCAVSVPTWYRLRSAGKIGPVPIRLGGRVLWRVEELTEWVRLGCPSRQEWEALKAQTNGRVR
jgi:predicted DNA-binding transcriptional regulator AlpA